MPSVGENLRTFLIGSTGVAAEFADISAEGVVQQGTVPENAPTPRIWYQRSGGQQEVMLDGELGLATSDWDIECHSEDIDESLRIAAAVQARLNGYRGTFGSTDDAGVKGILVEGHDDDYEPRGDASDEGLYVAALSVGIIE